MIARSSRSTLSPVPADTGTISANVPSSLYCCMIGSSFDFLIRSILFRIRKTGAFACFTRSMHEAVALARRLGHVDDQPEHVDLADRVDRGVDHAHVHAVQRAMDARRIEEHDLRVGIVLHAEDARPRRLRLVGDDGELGPDEPVEQRRLAGVGPADERDEAGFHDERRLASARSPMPACSVSSAVASLLVDPHLVDPPALGVEHLDAQAVELEALADRRDAADVRQQIAADGLEPFALDLDVQPLRDLVDVHLAAEDEAAVAFVDDRLRLDVVLVADLADDLLEQILDGDQPGGPAVFVDDDRALRLLALKLLQQLGHALGFGHDHRRPQQPA